MSLGCLDFLPQGRSERGVGETFTNSNWGIPLRNGAPLW